MGGGTPLFEASRLGLSVIGYDTNPMARWIVERELEDVDPDELRSAGERVAAAADAKLGRFYATSCTACGETAEARYLLWLRHHRCSCGKEHPLLADTMLVSTGLRRHPREVHLCATCLTIDEFKAGKRPKRCRRCKKSYDAGLVPPDSTRECECGECFRIPPQGTIETPVVRLVVIDYHCRACSARPGAPRHAYKVADTRDHELIREAAALAARSPSPFWPEQLIPHGTETERLLRWGYLRWMDLFNPRQLLALGTLASRIDAEPDGAVKRALQTAFSDLLRYQTMLCRYDRQALKPTDVFAVHGFPVPRVACEPHAIGTRGIGSGGFRHIVAKYERAKRWCRSPDEAMHDGKKLQRVPTEPERLAARFVHEASELGDCGDALLRRSSLRLGELPEDSVDLVLTDPPYYANVQYAELMDFCFAWLRRLAPDTPYFDVMAAKTEQDAVGAASLGGVDLVEFTRRLSEVFRASGKALKPGGAFIFTYHHNDLEAYAPVVVACLDARLTPTRLYGCPSEMRASTHIHGRNASTVDTVFVLRKPPVPAGVAVPGAGWGSSTVNARLSALRRAGLTPTLADRACIRHSVMAVRAIAVLSGSWETQLDPSERVAAALASLQAGPTCSVAVA